MSEDSGSHITVRTDAGPVVVCLPSNNASGGLKVLNAGKFAIINGKKFEPGVYEWDSSGFIRRLLPSATHQPDPTAAPHPEEQVYPEAQQERH